MTTNNITGGLTIHSGGLMIDGAPAAFAIWAAANAGGQSAERDFDQDGVRNGVEYFMGATGSTFTANPAIMNEKVIWPKDPAFSGICTVQTSPDRTIWTNADSTPAGNTIEFNVPQGAGRIFVRLDVKPD